MCQRSSRAFSAAEELDPAGRTEAMEIEVPQRLESVGEPTFFH